MLIHIIEDYHFFTQTFFDVSHGHTGGRRPQEIV